MAVYLTDVRFAGRNGIIRGQIVVEIPNHRGMTKNVFLYMYNNTKTWGNYTS